MKKLSFKSVARILFFIKLALIIITIALLFSSCRSSWSCKKRYVHQPKTVVINKYNC
jgi:hypothetical protein